MSRSQRLSVSRLDGHSVAFTAELGLGLREPAAPAVDAVLQGTGIGPVEANGGRIVHIHSFPPH